MRAIVWTDDAAGAALRASAARLHPEGIGATLAHVVRDEADSEAQVTVAGLHDADDGRPEGPLADADVLVWWGHEAHERVSDRNS